MLFGPSLVSATTTSTRYRQKEVPYLVQLPHSTYFYHEGRSSKFLGRIDTHPQNCTMSYARRLLMIRSVRTSLIFGRFLKFDLYVKRMELRHISDSFAHLSDKHFILLCIFLFELLLRLCSNVSEPKLF
jgi:hypothetical protein